MAGEKETIIKVGADTKQAQKSLGELERRFEQLNEEIRSDDVKVGSDRFNALSNELAQVTREIKNAELAFEGLDNEQVASEIGSVAGAVGDVSAAFVLLGDDSESMQEVAQNIETALGVSMAFKGAIEGISSARKLLNNSTRAQIAIQKVATAGQLAYGLALGTSTGAMKLFRLALLGTGIGILIAGVVALIANFDKLVGVVKDAANWLGRVTGFIEEVDIATAAATVAQKDFADETVKSNKVIIEAHERRTQALVDGLDYEIRKRKANGEDTAELEKQKLKLLIESSAKQLELIQENITALEDQIAVQEEQAGRIASLFDIDIAKNKARLNAQKKNQQETKDIQTKAIQDLEIFEIELSRIEREESKKRRDQRKADNEQRLKDEEKALELLEKLKRDFELRNLNDEQREIEELKIKLSEELSIAENDYRLQLKLQEEFEENKKAIEEKYRTEREAAEKQAQQNLYLVQQEALDKIEAEKEAKKQAEFDALNERFNKASQLTDSLSQLNSDALAAQLAAAEGNEEKQQEIRKKAFRRQKALDLAQATINGAQAILAALKSPLPLLAVPFAAALSAANIAKIASAKFDGEGGGGTPSGSLGNTARATGGANVPQVTNTTTTIGESTKVYVSEQDITNTQNRVTVAEQQGTL